MNTTPAASSDRVLYLIVCAAPAARDTAKLIQQAQGAGWLVRVITTPMGARFIDAEELAQLTGDRVRVDFRMPSDPNELPAAAAVLVAPATFNTINKWANGSADNFAVALLCELTGFKIPILAVPQLKAALATHRAFTRSLEELKLMGINLLFDPDAPPHARMPAWRRVLDELHAVAGVAGRAG